MKERKKTMESNEAMMEKYYSAQDYMTPEDWDEFIAAVNYEYERSFELEELEEA